MSAEIKLEYGSTSNVKLNQYIPSNDPSLNFNSDISIHHFQVGALVEPKKGQKVSPFGLFTLGASLFPSKRIKL